MLFIVAALGVQWWKKDDCDELLVVVTLGCATMEKKRLQR
jgi:hypothetical protein